MKKKKKMEGIVCSKCGGTIDPSTSNCSTCGSTALEQASTPTKEKKVPGFWGVLFSVIFSLLLTVSFTMLVLLLFIHALNENTIIPSIGPISSDWLAVFFDSWYSLVLGGALVLIPILIIVLINTNRMRRIFLAIGCSAIASAILSVVAMIIKKQVLKLLSGEWQDTLVNATAVFGDFCIVCAIVLIVIGAACLSIYSCIAVIKGGKHEKDN